ncbi:MAG: ATP-binding domain-containing protein, partial [Rhodospirillaceae bacterium]|nr:ATP-binding domain-containing protein [Rhodospirillaceae bacterium]
THTPSLEGFLHWVESGATQIKRDMEFSGPKVRVMTVHGAKGLEANVVFLPDTCTKPGHQTDEKIQWRIDAEQEDAPVILWSPVKQMRPKLVEQMILDARAVREREYRRLLYVAMTRARDRLYICGFARESGPADGSWYELVTDAVMERGKEIEVDGETIWRYETDQQHEPEIEPARGETVQATLPDWALVPPQPEAMPPSPLAPSRADETAAAASEPAAQSPFADGNTVRFKRGLLIHKLLELLPTIATEQRLEAALGWLSQPIHELDETSITGIARETLAVLEAPEFAPLFGTGGHSEAPIVGVAMGRVVSGRIDRLVINEDEVLIVDYKTNRPPPHKVADVASVYLQQMATYRTLLEQIYPTRAIRCFLLWTDGPRAMELTPEVLEPFCDPKTPA